MLHDEDPFRHHAAVPWLDGGLHCWPVWHILKEVILLSHDRKSYIVKHMSWKSIHTRDEGVSEAIIFIPCNSFTVGEEVSLCLIYFTPCLLLNKSVLQGYDSSTFHQVVKNFAKCKTKICPFNQDFPPEQQPQDVQSCNKQALALLHWKRKNDSMNMMVS